MRNHPPLRPIDTSAGRILVVLVAPLLAIGSVALKVDRDGLGPWWGFALIGVAVLMTSLFMAFWNRGYFGHHGQDDVE